MKTINKILLSAVALGLAACGSSDDPAKGSFSLSLTDAPISGAEEVWVDFTGIELHGPNGTIAIDVADKIDLLTLQGNTSELLASVTDLEPGNYQWMRLLVNAQKGVMDSTIVFVDQDGIRTEESLYVPSGAETGLKLNRPFVIAAGSRTDFTIDFDVRKSVHHPQGADSDYILRPTLRVINNLEVGTITGTVDAVVLTNNSCTDDNAAVYLFDGLDAEADDIDGLGVEPVTTANVDVATGAFEIGFVQAGLDYSVALTCSADLDDPEVDNLDLSVTPAIEDVLFIDQQNVSVAADEVVIADF